MPGTEPVNAPINPDPGGEVPGLRILAAEILRINEEVSSGST